MVTTDFGRTILLIAQAPRWRSLFLAILLLTIACWTWRTSEGGSQVSHPDFFWTQNGLKKVGAEDSVKSGHTQPSNLTLDQESGGGRQSLSAQVKKEVPQFHLLIHAPKINAGVCRCLLSSYILDYPPPTLIGYGPPSDLASPQIAMLEDGSETTEQNGIPDVADYLKNERRMKESDAVLVVDGASTLFQLPSEVLLSSFAAETRQRNSKLRHDYPQITLRSPEGDYTVQRFNSSVLFASTRETVTKPAGPPRLNIFGRTQQSLPETSVQHNLNDAAVIGNAKSLFRLFTFANRANNQFARSDNSTFCTMLAQQARVRLGVFSPQRLRRSIWSIWKLWLTFHWSVDAAVRAEEEKEARAAAVRDLGIGLDTESRLTYTFPDSRSTQAPREDRGIGYIESANATGLAMPPVLMEKSYRRPFAMHPFTLHDNATAPTKKTSERDEEGAGEADLPDQTTAWDQIPLILDPKTANIPSLVLGSSNDVWERLWFQPYARQLLNRYLIRGRSKEVAHEAARGGEGWWDSRGGRGGVWTTRGEWIEAGELCAGFGPEIFRDGKEVWEEFRKETVGPSLVPGPGVGVEVVHVTPDGEIIDDAQQNQGERDDEEEGDEEDGEDADEFQGGDVDGSDEEDVVAEGGWKSDEEAKEQIVEDPAKDEQKETVEMKNDDAKMEGESNEERPEETKVEDEETQEKPAGKTQEIKTQDVSEETAEDTKEGQSEDVQQDKPEIKEKSSEAGSSSLSEDGSQDEKKNDDDDDDGMPIAIMPDGSTKALSDFEHL